MAPNRCEVVSRDAQFVDKKHRPIGEGAPIGTRLDVFSISKDKDQLPWYCIKLSNGKDAYISDDDATLRKEAELLSPLGVIYEMRDINSSVLFELQKGARFGIWSNFEPISSDDWMEVEYRNLKGFMLKKNLYQLWAPTIELSRNLLVLIFLIWLGSLILMLILMGFMPWFVAALLAAMVAGFVLYTIRSLG